MTHPEPHPLAGQAVTLKEDLADPMRGVVVGGTEYQIEDWQDRVYGYSWMNASGNPAALIYAMRSAFADLPLDDEVLYGKIDGLGYIVHVSEILV